ncbi:MAG: pyrimidine 5'-nucleotidase [Proteobacteria bacterium]|nr:pyrimidine 5'-nucleotidase [Pseudomonadota bacterium]
MADDPDNKPLTDQTTADFAQIQTWVFDLDNTLYPVTENLLAQIDKHMGSFVANFLNVDAIEARRIQKSYFRKYGLTLRGLMLHHGLDPVRYYDEMTPMDLTQIDPHPALANALRKLRGRKVIYTNASAHHAEMVLDRLGMSDVFEGIYDITAAEYIPKPAIESYRVLCEQHKIDPTRAAMIDDIARNLEPAATLGMKTVWMRTGAEWAQDVEPEPYIDHIIGDILYWVQGIAGTGD